MGELLVFRGLSLDYCFDFANDFLEGLDRLFEGPFVQQVFDAILLFVFTVEGFNRLRLVESLLARIHFATHGYLEVGVAWFFLFLEEMVLALGH